MLGYITTVSILFIQALALADPLVTAAVQLAPRAADPSLVGYISQSGGGYDNGRTCDYPQTVSTSGSYFQCCSASGPCPFYTACSSNTLLGGSTAVPCDFEASLTCNTAVVVPTAGANNGVDYLACWQTTLGTGPFTFVQSIGNASVIAPTTTTGSSSAHSTSQSSSTTRATQGSSSSSQTTGSGGSTTSASTTSNAAMQGSADLSGVVGFIALVAQMIW